MPITRFYSRKTLCELLVSCGVYRRKCEFKNTKKRENEFSARDRRLVLGSCLDSWGEETFEAGRAWSGGESWGRAWTERNVRDRSPLSEALRGPERSEAPPPGVFPLRRGRLAVRAGLRRCIAVSQGFSCGLPFSRLASSSRAVSFPLGGRFPCGVAGRRRAAGLYVRRRERLGRRPPFPRLLRARPGQKTSRKRWRSGRLRRSFFSISKLNILTTTWACG